MPDAFTAGVKPGGLTSSTEIRILLCYLIKTAGPLTRDAMQGALLQEELVNYFEFVDALNELVFQQLASEDKDGYTITPKGAVVADTLADDLPRSVRESASRAVIRIQSWVHKAAQHRAKVEKTPQGYLVSCAIRDMDADMFTLTFTMPDELTAQTVKNQFIAHGSEAYAGLLECLTQNTAPEDLPPEAVQ